MGAIEPALALTRHRVTADEYQLMGRAGVLGPECRVELIEGEVIDMAPIGTRHWAVVSRLQRLLERAVGDLAVIATQSSLRLGERSEPQPDLGLFAPRDDFYAGALPSAADTLLLIEVSDTTARYDREVKLPLYARHGVRELWIVDLDAGLLRIYQEPRGESYLRGTQAVDPGPTAITALPGVLVDLTGVLR